MGPLQTSFLKEENLSEETGSLAPPVPFQLVHPSLDNQGNTFRGCDCHIELVFKSWKSDLQLAILPTKTQNPTLCYLYGRLLLIVLAYALCWALRTGLWSREQRELSVLKLVRYLQALADPSITTASTNPHACTSHANSTNRGHNCGRRSLC